MTPEGRTACFAGGDGTGKTLRRETAAWRSATVAAFPSCSAIESKASTSSRDMRRRFVTDPLQASALRGCEIDAVAMTFPRDGRLRPRRRRSVRESGLQAVLDGIVLRQCERFGKRAANPLRDGPLIPAIVVRRVSRECGGERLGSCAVQRAHTYKPREKSNRAPGECDSAMKA